MKFRLRYQSHDFELNEGQFLIGRSASCQLSLDDPLVSRIHAVLLVRSDCVVVEDLGSRNGVRINGERITRARALAPGDHISFGNQQVVLMRDSEGVADAQVQQPTQRVEIFGLVGGLADKALALGQSDEAERLVAFQLEQIIEDAARGLPTSPEVAARAAHYGVKLAAVTAKGRWLDYVFQLFTALARPFPVDVVDELYTVMRRVRPANPALLRQYLNALRKNPEFGPADRFLVGRIEGLAPLAGLK